jgi:hypothetical protein
MSISEGDEKVLFYLALLLSMGNARRMLKVLGSGHNSALTPIAIHRCIVRHSFARTGANDDFPAGRVLASGRNGTNFLMPVRM